MLQRKLLVLGLCAIGFLLSVASSNLSAQTYTDLHDFNCATEGCQPSNPQLLAQGRDGNLYGDIAGGGTYNLGTVFLATPSGTAATLYNFDSSSGDSMSGLTLGTDGNFYGTTWGGGVYENGTVFKVSTSGTLTTLHSCASSEGSPVAPPIQGKDKSFYGVTYGPNNYTAYEISAAGAYKTVGSSGPPYVEAPLLQASDGNFYGPSVSTNVNGGCGSIFRMSATGTVSTVYTFDNTHGCNPVGPLVQDAKGYLYGTTWSGGSFDLGVVFRLTTKGVLTVLHDFDGTTGANPLPVLCWQRMAISTAAPPSQEWDWAEFYSKSRPLAITPSCTTPATVNMVGVFPRLRRSTRMARFMGWPEEELTVTGCSTAWMWGWLRSQSS